MTTPLLQQGLDLMIYGMSTVFFFLALLVTVTVIASKILGRFFPEATEIKPPTNTSMSAKASVDRRLLAILQDAIDQHRKHK